MEWTRQGSLLPAAAPTEDSMRDPHDSSTSIDVQDCACSNLAHLLSGAGYHCGGLVLVSRECLLEILLQLP